MVYDLPQMDGIDWEVAHHYLSSQEMLIDTLCEYVKTAARQTAELTSFKEQAEQQPSSENFANFRIKAHAMKSTLRSIGSDLYEQAFRLETAGRDEDIDIISDETADFCRRYLAVAEKLREITGDVDAGTDFDEGLFYEKIAEIKSSMQTFDINNLQAAFSVIQDMNTPEKYDEDLKKLETAIRDLESEQVMTICDLLVQ